jgi:RNA polymerase sigma-70 factor (ECF subfamily)
MITDMINGSVTDKDLELLRKISCGDKEAFRELYDLTHKKVYFYLFRLLRRRQAAEDILIETYTAVWKGAKNFKGKARATTWIIAIARNLGMNELRKFKNLNNIEDFPNLSDGHFQDMEQIDRQRFLREAMLSLSIKHREILDLVFFHEMTYPEVSEILRIPVNTVKTRIYYAKEALKEILSRMGVNRDEL